MERLMLQPIPTTKAVTEEDQQNAIVSGRHILQRTVDFHNRATRIRWVQVLCGHFCPFTIVIAISMCIFLFGARPSCQLGNLLSPDVIKDEFVAAETFDLWAVKAEKRVQTPSNLVRFGYSVVSELGYAHTRKLNDCLELNASQSDHVNNCLEKYLTRLHLVVPEGFSKGAMLIHSPYTKNLTGEANCVLQRTPALLEDIGINPIMTKNKKHVARINHTDQFGNPFSFRYDFGDKLKLMPLAGNCEAPTESNDMLCFRWKHFSPVFAFCVLLACVGVQLLLPYRGLLGVRNLKKTGGLPRRSGCDEILRALSAPYEDIFDKTSTKTRMAAIVLEDIGLSQKFGVLFEEPGTLLSQNFVFASTKTEMFAGGVHIKTSCEIHQQHTPNEKWVINDPVMHASAELPPATGRRLLNRLRDSTWLDFQVLRQVNLRMFKVASDGGILLIDPVSFMPRPANDVDRAALQPCRTYNSFQQEPLCRTISRGIANPHVEVSELLKAVAPVYLAREDAAELWASPVVCAVTYDQAHRFVVIEKHLYSWEALRAFIVDVGRKNITDGVVAYGPGRTDRAFLQTDPMKAVISKSTMVDFGLEVSEVASFTKLEKTPTMQRRSRKEDPIQNASRHPRRAQAEHQKQPEFNSVQHLPDGDRTLANLQLSLWQAMHSADPDQLAKALTAARGWIDSSLFDVANRQLQVLLSRRGHRGCDADSFNQSSFISDESAGDHGIAGMNSVGESQNQSAIDELDDTIAEANDPAGWLTDDGF